METPISPPSAMKGVILTSTGEILTTPSPTEFVLFQPFGTTTTDEDSSTGNVIYLCILLVSITMAIAPRLPTGIVRPNPFPIYDHLVVAPISPLPLLPSGHYRFQHHPSPQYDLRTRRIYLLHL